MLAALAFLVLPQTAGATVYDKTLHDQLVEDGVAEERAVCMSALAGARVTLERYVEGYFVAVEFDGTQHTDEDGSYSWEVGEGEHRVSVTKPGYWRAFSGIVIGPSAVLDEDVGLKRRPGTPPPDPRDCAEEPEPQPEPEPEPEPEDPDDRDPKGDDGPDAEARPDCLLRPVSARVRGSSVAKVVYFLDGRRIKTVSRPDAEGVYGVTVERTRLARGKHVLRAKVMFVARANRRPEFLQLAIRRCPERMPARIAKADPPNGCTAAPFRAWVQANRVRRVAFRLNGRRLRTVSVADWRGRYGLTIRSRAMRNGTNVVKARVEFLEGSRTERRTVRFRFKKCS